MNKFLLVVAVTVTLVPLVGLAQNFKEGADAYLDGDFSTALKVWRPLAEQGNAKAQHNLGVMYKKGEGGTYDLSEAVYWFRKAAEQGNVDAHTSLGAMYYNGEGVIRDNVFAYMWFDIAASRGNTDAQESRNVIGIRMTPEDISMAQEFAQECVRKKLKG